MEEAITTHLLQNYSFWAVSSPEMVPVIGIPADSEVDSEAALAVSAALEEDHLAVEVPVVPGKRWRRILLFSFLIKCLYNF